LHYDFIEFGMTLQDIFDADVTGRDFEQGKPHPMIFLTAAEELGVAPHLAIPTANAAERQIARRAEGADLEEIYAEQVRPREPVGG
jgi:hypothetical protein